MSGEDPTMTDTPRPIRTPQEARERLRRTFEKGGWWPLMELAWSEVAAPAHKHDPDACADCFDMITEEMTVSD